MPNTIEILSSINMAVKKIAESMAPQNGSGKEAMNKLAKGDVANKQDVNQATRVAKSNISKASLSEVVNFLNTLSPSILAVAKLSGSTMKKFTSVIDVIIKDINKMSKETKTSQTAIKAMSDYIHSLVKLAKEVKNMPDVGSKVKRLNFITKAIDDIIKVVAKSILLIGVCIGLGYLISKGPGKELILNGLLVLGTVLLTIVALIGIVALASMMIKTTGALFAIKEIMMLALGSIALVALCFALGMVIDSMGGWEPLFKGLLVVGATMIMLAFIFWLIGGVAQIAEASGTMKAIGAIFLLSVGSILLIVAAKYLGDFTIEHYDKIALGLFDVVLVFGLILGVAYAADKVARHAKRGVIALAAVEGLALGAMGVVWVASKLADSIKGKGLAILDAISLSITIIALMGVLAYTAGAFGYTTILQGALALGGVELVVAGAVGVMWLLVELEKNMDANGVHLIELIADMYLINMIIMFYTSLATGLGFLIEFVALGVAALALVELVVAGAIGIGFLLVQLHKVKEESGVGWDDMLLDVMGIDLILVEFGVMAALFAGLSVPAALGAAALIPVELMATGAIGIIHLLIGLHERIKENGIELAEIRDEVFQIGLIMGEFGLLAAAFGLLIVPVTLGNAALIPTEIMIVGLVGVMHLLIGLHQRIKENNIDLTEIRDEILQIDLIFASVVPLMLGAAALIVPLNLGMPGLLLVSGALTLISGVMLGLSAVAIVLDKIGGIDKIYKLMSSDIPMIMRSINSKNLNPEIGIIELGKLAIKYSIVAKLTKDILTVAEAISKFAKIGGMVDDSGSIRPILFINENTGEIVYGEPVNLVNISTAVAQSVKAFVENSQYSFQDVANMVKAGKIFEILGVIVDPLTKFVEMLTGYVGDMNGETLTPVHIDQDGKITYGAAVKVRDVASIIAGTVSTFVEELFSEKNVKAWSSIVYGDADWIDDILGRGGKSFRSAQEVAGVFGLIIEPITKFIDMLVGLEPQGDGKLSKIIIDSQGNVKSGVPVDVKKVAKTVADLVSSFVKLVYDDKNGFSAFDDFDPNNVDKLLKPINSMIKIVEELSSDKINAELSKEVTDAIFYANTKLVASIIGYDAAQLEKNIIPLEKIVNLGASISTRIDEMQVLKNTKSVSSFITTIVDKKLTASTKKVDKFTVSVNKMKKGLSSLDDVLIKSDSKRTKALDNFDKKVTKIINTIKDSSTYIGNFIKAMKEAEKFKEQPTPPPVRRETNQNTSTKIKEYERAKDKVVKPDSEDKKIGGTIINNPNIGSIFADVISGIKMKCNNEESGEWTIVVTSVGDGDTTTTDMYNYKEIER